MTEDYEPEDLHPIHAWIARFGVLCIAVIAFMFVYDAGVTFAQAVGYRIALGRLWPWLIEGFLALVVYTGSILRMRGQSVTYPAFLFCVLLSVSGYMNVRVHTHHGPAPLILAPVESGSASALPVLILAGSVHLLIRTFENTKRKRRGRQPFEDQLRGIAGPNAMRVGMPESPLTAEGLQEAWAGQLEPVPADIVAQEEAPEVEPEAFTLPELNALPAQRPAAPQLNGQSNFLRMAQQAPTEAARNMWLSLAGKQPAQPALF